MTAPRTLCELYVLAIVIVLDLGELPCVRPLLLRDRNR